MAKKIIITLTLDQVLELGEDLNLEEIIGRIESTQIQIIDEDKPAIPIQDNPRTN